MSHIKLFCVKGIRPHRNSLHWLGLGVAFMEVLQSADFTLAQVALPVDHKSIAICVTLYNESIDLFRPTFQSIITGIDVLSANDPQYRRAIICVIVDGRSDMPESVASYLKTLGLTDVVPSDQPVPVAVSECQLAPKIGAHPAHRDVFAHLPITVRVIQKEENVGKLDSHWWFYETVCIDFSPNYCFQIDAGTVLADHALTEMCATFEAERNTAAIAGGILIKPGSNSDLVHHFQCGDFAVQKTIRWPSELLSGYLSVIPGQFSGVRWSAMSRKIDGDGQSPKDRYLRGRQCGTAAEKMMYLAEDRVLGLELLSQPGAQNHLQYASHATCHTDACNTVEELLKQRRRWLNGNLICRFSMAKAVLRSIGDHSQTISRRFSMATTLLNLWVQLLLEWFLPLVHVLLMAITWHSLSLLSGGAKAASITTFTLIAVIWFLPTLLAIAGRLQKWPKPRVQILMKLVILDFLLIAGINGIGVSQRPDLIAYVYLLCMPVILGITALLSAMVLNRDLIAPLRRSVLPFVMLAPAIWLMLSCFAFFNLHDASWGTKGLSRLRNIRAGQEARIIRELRWLRLGVVLGWLISNLLLGVVIVLGGFLPLSVTAIGGLQLVMILSGLAGAIAMRATRASRSGKNGATGFLRQFFTGGFRNGQPASENQRQVL